jgi:hypothetical protein
MGGVNSLKNLNSFELCFFTAGLRTLRGIARNNGCVGSDNGPSAEGTGRIAVSGHGEPERCLAVLDPIMQSSPIMYVRRAKEAADDYLDAQVELVR